VNRTELLEHLVGEGEQGRVSRGVGIVRPSVIAVLALITSSNLPGRSTGRSLAFSPFRILSARIMARR